jgi:hypothetical protein
VEKKKELIKKSKSSLKRKIPMDSIEESPSKKTKMDINDNSSEIKEIVPVEKFEDEEVPPIEIN